MTFHLAGLEVRNPSLQKDIKDGLGDCSTNSGFQIEPHIISYYHPNVSSSTSANRRLEDTDATKSILILFFQLYQLYHDQ